MSENIQSISQGTYTIGQTSATNFVAGPGISISEPSAGTVRIGTDETVLWETTLNSGSSAFNTSEPVSNFEKYKIRDFRGQYFEFDSNDLNPCFSNISNWSTNRYIRLGGFNINGTSFTNTYGSEISITNAGAVTLNNNYTSMINGISQVIGINRISGGNE